MRDKFLGVLATDFYDLFIDEEIGSGYSRKVYKFRYDPKYVVKFEFNTAALFQNAHEWRAWTVVKDGPMAKWFAPCKAISDCGTVLIQARVENVPWKHLPKNLPKIFNDVKKSNWGYYKDRIVCCDYGIVTPYLLNYVKGKEKAKWK